MIKKILATVVLLFGINNFVLADSTDSYFPDYNDHKYRFGKFWGSLTIGGYTPIGTLSDNLDISSGAGVGFSFLDIFGVEVRGAYQLYDKKSMILSESGLVPSDTPGNELIHKIDTTAFLVIQPSFKVAKDFFIAPYIGAGADFSFISYSYYRDSPRYTYETTMTLFGFAGKAGVRFRFSNMLIGAGVEYIYAVPSDFYGIDFSSLTYALELGFVI